MASSSSNHDLDLSRWCGLWCALIVLGGLTGSACALFLATLNAVTHWRTVYPGLTGLLPLMGVVVGWLYTRYGREVEAGNNSLIQQIQVPDTGVSPVMAPLIFMTTLLTHLGGGSAGREGTAVQMGGAIAGGIARFTRRFRPEELRILLLTGMASGFGGVFGTPVAGALFALEVVRLGQLETRALIPCLVTAIISDRTCTAWGIEHPQYAVTSLLPAGTTNVLAPWDWRLIIFAIGSGVAFGLVSRLFVATHHACQALFRRMSESPLLRPLLGGVIVLGITGLLGTRDYLGIGITSPTPGGVSLTGAFEPGRVSTLSWFWKLLLTAITLGSGFKGGEATPLFFMGATLGHTLAVQTGCPVDLCASLGFVAVFMAATRTPIAGIVMAVEMFGGEAVLYHALACSTACMVNRHHGIYSAQKPCEVIARSP